MMNSERHDRVSRTSPATRTLTGSWHRSRRRFAWAFLSVLLCCVHASAAEPSARTQATSTASLAAPAIERAFISFRIGVPQWMPEGRYRELLALFEKYQGVTDEITFFTSATHPPLPLEEIKRRCEILSRRIPQARARG